MADHQQGGHAVGAGEQAFLALDITDLVANRLRTEDVAGAGNGLDGCAHRRRHVEVDRLGTDVGGRIDRARAMIQAHGLGCGRGVLDQPQVAGRVAAAG